ncbi:MAG: dihydropteroate synthase [Anaerolineaceae bacterium]|nr:dihydropteroate synthase [Anaerolineaceae bacterium]MBN2677425.1 dihydropteroate synthase [Anaerolineaceae bacterium]
MKNTFADFSWGERTYIMGIINITPDSFSGDGLLVHENVLDQVLEQARNFITAGADILDIGGESTRPGAPPISEEEELRRVIPIIQALINENLGIPLSLDTYKASVAETGLQMGVDWINDIWALRADPRMTEVVKKHKAPLILMHNRSQPADPKLALRLSNYPQGTQYDDLAKDVITELLQSVTLAHSAGITDDMIILDPGIGFGKTVEQNMTLIAHLNEIHELGYPVLLGPSRKSFIGLTLDLPPDQRLEGTLAAVGLGIMRGADIIRVHDVGATVRFVRMLDAMRQYM